MLLPVIFSLVMTAAATLAFVLWSAQGVDQREAVRQTEFARHIIDSEVESLPRDQESVTIWDDSVAHVAQNFDRAWVHANLGKWMHDFFGHDDVYILDPQNRPVYLMLDGAEADDADISVSLADLAEMLAQLRRQMVAGGVAAFQRSEADHPPRVIDFISLAGVPSLVSMVPIISETGDLRQAAGSEFVHVAIIRLDADYAQRLGSEYFLSDVGFGLTQSDDAARAELPLTNGAGRFVSFLQWQLTTPGQAMLRQTLPAIAGAFLVAAIIALVLLEQLRRKSLALAIGRAEAERQASEDRLTGLPNRTGFEATLARTLAQGVKTGLRVSLLMLDLDRFKQINDTLGHQAGDDLLEAVAQRLAEFVARPDLLARLGGDEFAVIHVHDTGAPDPLQLSDQLIDVIGKPFVLAGGEAFVGVSIGISTTEDDDADASELTRQAEIALHEAMAGGGNRAVVFTQPMSELLQNRRTLEAELREALRSGGQLSAAFQPLYGSDRTQIRGAEALARWRHPRLGQISPAHFIPIAETSGLIEGIGEFVLRETCRVGAQWPGIFFAVNISPAQLRNPQFPGLVFDLLTETGMRAHDLELEITEGILLEDASSTIEALHIFRNAGIRIALDDFGTGYSSLNYLKRYPVDRIKIDRSFVSQLHSGSVSIAIVQAMVTLAHALNIEVTAEGVETAEQLRLLNDLGCNIFQGFLLCPPVAPEKLTELLQQAPMPSERMRQQIA